MQFQKISISPPWKISGNSKGEGVVSAKVLKERYGAKLEFPEGWWGLDIFQNHTLWGYKCCYQQRWDCPKYLGMITGIFKYQ